MCITLATMATTTVRLDAADEALLDRLAEVYGGRSAAIRHALRALAVEVEERESLDDFLAAWEAEVGPVDEAGVTRMAERYGL